MTPPRIVEALDVSNTSALAWSRVRYVLRAVLSILSEEKKLSIAALSCGANVAAMLTFIANPGPTAVKLSYEHLLCYIHLMWFAH
jgi:hypothetical protein